MFVRAHRRSDADAIAEILAAGWKQAYSHFMPAAFLAPRIDPAYRRREIAQWLDEDFDPAEEALFVADDDGLPIGFIHMAPGDKGDVGAAGHVSLLYVDPARQGRGIGRALMAEGARWLLARAPGPLALSAFEQNACRAAYDRMGGRQAKRMRPLIEGVEVETVIYVWDDPQVLTV
jgi:GNAT superfamily N-acetyltransferase